MPIVAVNGGGNTPNGRVYEAHGAYLLTGVEHTAREFLGEDNTLIFSQGASETGPIHPSLLGLHVDTSAVGSRLFVGNLSLDSADPQRGTEGFQILSAGKDGLWLPGGSHGDHTTLSGDWDLLL